MLIQRVAVFAAFLISFPVAAKADDATLTSRDGTVQVSGNLLGYDGEFYRIDTEFGILTCSIPDDHIDPRRSALFMARSVLREAQNGDRTC